MVEFLFVSDTDMALGNVGIIVQCEKILIFVWNLTEFFCLTRIWDSLPCFHIERNGSITSGSAWEKRTPKGQTLH